MSGIDQVLFTQNTSPIPDEMLAHRLGMVPLISQKVMDGLRYTRVSLSPHSTLPRNTSSRDGLPDLAQRLTYRTVNVMKVVISV